MFVFVSHFGSLFWEDNQILYVHTYIHMHTYCVAGKNLNAMAQKEISRSCIYLASEEEEDLTRDCSLDLNMATPCQDYGQVREACTNQSATLPRLHRCE